MKRVRIGILAVCGIALAGCTSSSGTRRVEKSPQQIGAPAKNDQYPVIGYLEKQDRLITIKAGPKGTLYSIATKGGKELFENVSAEQLKAQAPELHELIKTGVAGDARMQNTKIDGSLRR